MISRADNKKNLRLYQDLSWTWPIISPKEEYLKESEEFISAIRGHSILVPKTLLVLGSGGGHNDWALKNHFQITGVDISRDMLDLARSLNPEVEYFQADMRTVRLGRKFDAVFITDAVNYMLTEQDLGAAFHTGFEHLRPGGVFISFAENTRERFIQNRTSSSTNTARDIEITLIENYYAPDPAASTYENTMIYLIREKGRLRVEVDRHLQGLFPVKTWIDLLTNAGFAVKQMEFVEGYCPLFVGIKP